MTKTIQTIGLLLVLTLGQFAFGQSNKDKAFEKGNQAIKLEDEGKIDEAIKLLEEAQKLAPNDINYPYELGYAYYVKTDYKKASKYLEGILKHKDIKDRVYQLLGNCYDNLGKSEKAMATYEEGLKSFPNSGNLYLEMGVVQLRKKEYNKALSYYEKGIETDPKFSSNYYWASKIYCSSTEEVWGMIYGEIFMNLERNSKRTAEISKLLFDTYKSQIKFTSDTAMSVGFCQRMTMDINSLSDTKNAKLPFCMIYEPTLLLSIGGEKSINLKSLNRIREGFVQNYFKFEHSNTHPNILFDYQKMILQAGYLEAYNHWILMKGEEDEFEQWQSSNKEKWDNFVKWFSDNKIQIDNTHKFFSGQY